jgi:hypothetical protein
MPHPTFDALVYIQERFDDPENMLTFVCREQSCNAYGFKIGGKILRM